MESTPTVSIYVTTYNHENYIERALDSILMQKTRYSCEVLVGEDCSTDRTREIVKDWERRHPGKFTFFYRETNTYHTDCPNGLDLKLRCKGKYIVCLEGDDFWTDPEKLEKQITFLEEHPEYYAVAHNCIVVGEDSLPNGETYPECKDGEYTLRHFASEIMPGQLTTFLSRNYMTDPDFDRDLVLGRCGPGDRNIYFSVACHGKIHCMQEVMSAYRHITSKGSSYSANYVYGYEKEAAPLRNRIAYAKKLGHKEGERCASFQFLLHARYAFRIRAIGLSRLWSEFRQVPRWFRFGYWFVKRDFRRLITHRTPYI